MQEKNGMEREFLLKFIITKLHMFDDPDNGYSDVLLVLTFDNQVVKFKNIPNEHGDDSVNIGRELLFHMTAKDFSEKLRCSPVFMNLSRGEKDLGKIKLDIECLADVVELDGFSNKKKICDGTFIENGIENADIEVVVKIARSHMNMDIFGVQRLQHNYDDTSLSFDDDSNDNSSSFDDNELQTDLCPMDEESEDRQTTSFQASSSKTKSTKCYSDIATSLDITCFPDQQKTFCPGCGGFSISGVTCEHKLLYKSFDEISNHSPNQCQQSTQQCLKSANRICSDCFEDLTVLCENAPCPRCKQNKCRETPTKMNKIDPKLTRDYVASMIKNIMSDEVAVVKKLIEKKKNETEKMPQEKKLKVSKSEGQKSKR